MFLWIFCTGVQRVIFHDDHRRGVPAPAESHRMGLTSIRRIAQGYGGSVRVEETGGQFGICVIFRNL